MVVYSSLREYSANFMPKYIKNDRKKQEIGYKRVSDSSSAAQWSLKYTIAVYVQLKKIDHLLKKYYTRNELLVQ